MPDPILLFLWLLGNESPEGPLDFWAVNPDPYCFDYWLSPGTPMSIQNPHDGRQNHVARIWSMSDSTNNHILQRDKLLLLFVFNHISSLEQKQFWVTQSLLQELIPFDYEITLNLSEILLRHKIPNFFLVCVLLHLLVFVDEIASVLHLTLLLHF